MGSDKEWWENRRAGIQSDFMKELEGDSKTADTSQQPKKTGSDDDAVLVEAGGPAQAQGAGKNKKKNKK